MPSTDWKEVITRDEAERHEKQALRLVELQRRNTRAAGNGRALHRRSLGGFSATFEVLGEIPDHAKVGLFASPRTFDARVRFSSGSASPQSDRVPDIRGIAIKLLDVEGPKIIPGLEGATTQDFLMNQTPAVPFRSSEDFVKLVWAARSKALALPRLIAAFGFRGATKLIGTLKQELASSRRPLDQQRFYSQLPIKFGPYAAHLGLEPVQASSPGRSGGDSLLEELTRRLTNAPVAFDFTVQFFEDEQRTPIEDSSVLWPESVSPRLPIARLTLGRQDARSPEGQKLHDEIERMSFDPWHTTEDFRPLGEMMRARAVAYKHTSIERNAATEPGVGAPSQAGQDDA